MTEIVKSFPISTPNSRQSTQLTLSPSPRSDLYKNKEKSNKSLRRRRSETVVELRKQKKNENKDKRRNISLYECWSDNEDIVDDGEGEENQSDVNTILSALKSSHIWDIPSKCIRYLRHSLPKGRESRTVEEKAIMNSLLVEDVIIKLINCLTSEESSMSLLYEVVALMAHICSGDKNVVLDLVNRGIVPNLLSLLSYDNFGVMEQSVLALTYIWNSCPEMSQFISKSTQFLKFLVNLIDSETSVSPSKYVQMDSRMGLVRSISWSLFVMCQSHELDSYRLSVVLMPYFLKLMNYYDNEVKTNVLKALSATTERVLTLPEDESSPVLQVVQSVVSNDLVFTAIIDELDSKDDDVVLNAIRIIGNIVSWGESYAQIVIQTKVLHNFNEILRHKDSGVQREAAFTVSNITAGNLAQIQAVIDSNIIPSIVELLYMGDYRSQVEANHVLLNITAVGSAQQILYLLNMENTIINMDVIDAMATLMTSTDAKTILVCLQFYNNALVFAKRANILSEIIKRCENTSVLYYLESLQTHRNSDVAVLSSHILDQYFSQDSSLEEEMILNTNTSLGLDDKSMDFSF